MDGWMDGGKEGKKEDRERRVSRLASGKPAEPTTIREHTREEM